MSVKLGLDGWAVLGTCKTPWTLAAVGLVHRRVVKNEARFCAIPSRLGRGRIITKAGAVGAALSRTSTTRSVTVRARGTAFGARRPAAWTLSEPVSWADTRS